MSLDNIAWINKECVACALLGLFVDKTAGWIFCQKHAKDVYESSELTNDLAREIYVEEWLIPQKAKKK